MHLGGLSIGELIPLDLALRAPARVASLVLCNTARDPAGAFLARPYRHGARGRVGTGGERRVGALCCSA